MDKSNQENFIVTSFNQQGGITAGQINLGKQERHVSAQFKASLAPHLPKDKEKEIVVSSTLGDTEARQFAEEIKQYLEDEGYKVLGVNEVVRKRLVIGQEIVLSEDGGIEIKIGGRK
jgi:hypothetical protein